jgi:hypothetical protein
VGLSQGEHWAKIIVDMHSDVGKGLVLAFGIAMLIYSMFTVCIVDRGQGQAFAEYLVATEPDRPFWC